VHGDRDWVLLRGAVDGVVSNEVVYVFNMQGASGRVQRPGLGCLKSLQRIPQEVPLQP